MAKEKSTVTDDGGLSLEINPILKNETGVAKGIGHKVWLYTPKLDIRIEMLGALEVLRDYNGNIGDYVVIDFLMSSATYVRDVHPYRDNLEIEIYEEIVNQETKTIEYADMRRYKFVMLNQKGTDSELLGSQEREEMNTSTMKRIVGQCIDRELELLKSVSVRGIFRDTTVDKVIQSEFGTLKDMDLKIEGKQMEVPCTLLKEVDNKQQYDHVIVGSSKGKGTNIAIMDLPSYLQNTKYGVYNGNIFTYMQDYKGKKSVFIGPLYDSTQFENTEKLPKLTIVRPNTINYDNAENTFFVDGDIVKVLCKSNVQLVDTGENEFISEGSAYTYTNPTAILNRDGVVADNKVRVDKETRMGSDVIKERRDQNVASTYIGSTVNLYRYRSDFVRATMAIYQIQWIHCDINLIYPGMPVCYMYYEAKRGIVKTYGTVQSTYQRYNKEQGTRVGMINIVVEKPIFKEKLEGDDRENDVVDF